MFLSSNLVFPAVQVWALEALPGTSFPSLLGYDHRHWHCDSALMYFSSPNHRYGFTGTVCPRIAPESKTRGCSGRPGVRVTAGAPPGLDRVTLTGAGSS